MTGTVIDACQIFAFLSSSVRNRVGYAFEDFFKNFYILIHFLKCVKDIICTRKKVRLLGLWETFSALLSDGISH